MELRKMANELKGWNTLDDISKKLKIKKTSVYVYLYKLNKMGFIIQKIKKSRGTMYLISPIPTHGKHFGMYENTELVAPEIEFTKREISPEQKIAYFLSLFKKNNNIRYYEESKRLIRSIKNWKRMYKYIKAYDVKKLFKKLYSEVRNEMKKIPKMPKRYEKLLSV
jgi:predicted transcriptional regulator